VYVPHAKNDTYYSFKYNDAYLIFLNSLDFTTAQEQWLKDELETSRSTKWTILFTHDLNIELAGNRTLAKLALDSNIDALISMGTHYERSWVDSDKPKCVSIRQPPLPGDDLVRISGPSDETASYGVMDLTRNYFYWRQLGIETHEIIDSFDVAYVRGSSKSSNDSYDDWWASLSIIGILGATLLIAIVLKCLTKQAPRSVSRSRPGTETEMLSVELIHDDD
jgi:hypothetical protein